MAREAGCWDGLVRGRGGAGPGGPQPTLAGGLAPFQGWTLLPGLNQGLALRDSHQLFSPRSIRKQQPHFLWERTSHETSIPGD